MARPRLELQSLLESILGSRNVYFQPPPSIQIHYPAIVYNLSNMQNNPANNAKYIRHNAYRLTIIDEDPDSEIPETILGLPLCSFNNSFTADNLNHFVFTIYY